MCSVNRLLFVALVALTAAVLAVVTPAAAKEGVVARVLTPIVRSAEPGTKVKVVWTLYHVEDGERVPFSATGVFIRLFGSGGSHSARVYATQSELGRYRAVVNVPPGGVRRVVIGLMGTSCGPSGCSPSPAIFEIVGRSVG
jgi:hypothetical protein